MLSMYRYFPAAMEVNPMREALNAMVADLEVMAKECACDDNVVLT
eukprot:SAG31_NODE_4190_length_3489_cov_3.603835_1_plen_45_part_00